MSSNTELTCPSSFVRFTSKHPSPTLALKRHYVNEPAKQAAGVAPGVSPGYFCNKEFQERRRGEREIGSYQIFCRPLKRAELCG